MRLKQLEIKGFKSFANETVINFTEDVIGIVGPNGSGKSNIVDAIRWVLGEQKSRELRLDQMSSVIFNGAKKRKAGGVAQVSLTFENTKNLLPTEYHTVTITRMLYRTGESEYRLNGVPCRLKDINTLLLDTGIGSNSYAIIALGMVDDILADKDNARRRMFEQAAGISKYKLRKRETINKLNSTTADLDRVEDLLYEIDANLKTLEKQARRTKRYFELKEQYKQLALNLAHLRIGDLKTEQQSLQKQLDTEQHNHRQLEIEAGKREAQLEADRKGHLDKEKALSERQKELNELVGTIRSKEGDKKMHAQRLQFLDENQRKRRQEIETAQQRMRELEEAITHYRSQLKGEKRSEEALESQLEQAEGKLQNIKSKHGSLKAELEEVVEEQQELERDVYELEKQKAINANQVQSGQQEISQGSEEMEERRQEVKQLREKLHILEGEEKQALEQLEDLNRAEAERQQELDKAEKQLESINQKMAAANRDLDAKRNEYQLTKSMVENLEGFPESIRFLNKNKEWGAEAPLLSDLIYVKEEYRIAIENYLEPYLNYYVVQNIGEARQAIELLGRSQKGKANFFLLDAFRNYSPPINLLPETQRAIDLVETDAAYRNLCSYLLENVLITDSDHLPEQLPEGEVVLLSKSGRFIQRPFSLSGGSIGLFEGKKIGRKKNLEILQEAIRKAEKEEKKRSTEYYNLKNRIEHLKTEHAKDQIQEVQTTLNRLGQNKASLSTRLENFESFIQQADAKREKAEQRIRELREKNTAIEGQLGEKKEYVKVIKNKIAETDDVYREVAEQLSQASTAYNEKNIEFIRQQNKVDALQKDLSFREKQLEDNRQSLKNNQQALEEGELEMQEVQEKLQTLETELRETYEQRQEREAQLTEAEQIYFKVRGEINDQEDQLRKLHKKQQDAQSLINQLKDKYNEVKYEISSVAQRLRIEFEIDINDLINEAPQSEQPADELETKVIKIKNRLDNYGEINPMAVEAYDEMKQRHEAITKQRDDILQAKESLMQTIQEIEETATSQFLEAFEKVREHFQEVFRSLFTESDNCDLLLLEPENPLESKIEIVAKPRGKRPQSINQLSGGEKTLTATALLFALYLLKPAPFCIFDEVDAPLDDANIEKFNKIIRNFSKDSQFIIVTHNKLTMAAVNTIYGVYMAEQGVSGVSAVDLRDFEFSGAFELSDQE